jgi:hypothetical protein
MKHHVIAERRSVPAHCPIAITVGRGQECCSFDLGGSNDGPVCWVALQVKLGGCDANITINGISSNPRPRDFLF